jgi:hypothetical protein
VPREFADGHTGSNRTPPVGPATPLQLVDRCIGFAGTLLLVATIAGLVLGVIAALWGPSDRRRQGRFHTSAVVLI